MIGTRLDLTAVEQSTSLLASDVPVLAFEGLVGEHGGEGQESPLQRLGELLRTSSFSRVKTERAASMAALRMDGRLRDTLDRVKGLDLAI